MFTSSFDKLANEVRDIRIKYVKIDHMLNLLKLESKHNGNNIHNKKLKNIVYNKMINEDIEAENVPEEDFESGITLDEVDYVKLKENFKNTFNKSCPNNLISEEDVTEEDVTEEENRIEAEEYESAYNFDDTDYYDSVNFKETFKQNDIIEEFI